MPRIPDADIDRIKHDADLAALVRSRGIALKKHGGGNLIGKCPFHEDGDNPNLIVTPGKGLFHCMACGKAGNAIQFVEQFDGVSFRHAFELLNDGKAMFSAPDGHVKQHTVRRLDTPVTPNAADPELLGQVVDYYHDRLQHSPPAIEYLKQRGIYDKEAIECFRIGFADRTLGLRLPEKNRKAGAEMRSRLQAVGLIRKSGHEHFNGSLVLPIVDPETGHVAEIYGRKVNDNLRVGTPRHLYLPGPHGGIWNADALSDPAGVVLCEAPLDALTLWVHGIRNTTFIFGTEGFPDYLFDALLKHHIKAVRLAYDADDAGDRAAVRDTERLAAHGIDVYRIKFPRKMDVNSYARQMGGDAAKALRRAVDTAELHVSTRSHASHDIAPTCVPAPSLESLAANNLAASTTPQATPPKPSAPEVQEAANNLTAETPPAPALTRIGEATGTSYHVLELGPRQYRVSGLERNHGLDVLKISLRLRYYAPALHSSESDGGFHLDSIDMTRDGERRRFIERAAEETGLEKELIKRDLGKLLLALEEAQQERLAPTDAARPDNAPELTEAERAEALEFLCAPDLIGKITEAFDTCGLVGETSNRLAAYLACTSRKLDRPLAVIIQSTSAAGKSTLMDAVLAMFPEEERIQYSAMTGQSLYYLGETDLKHRILAIVEEEGAEKASYALKLLQSEGELTIASTGKDPTTGRMETQEYHVEGPVMIFLTTTSVDIDEELQNRCLTLTVDESREQTERIHTLQRQARTLDGLRLKKQRKRTLTLLRNVQRLLESVDVVNPWADRLTFTAERTRTRRDHEKYLTLIDTIALLHQHQRTRCQLAEDSDQSEHSGYISVTLDDIELANQLAPELLGRSLDELPPQTRRLYDAAKALVRERMKTDAVEQRFAFFSRREVREHLGWSITQVRVHLERLRHFEYIAARLGRSGSAFQYELLTDCNETDHCSQVGLLDVASLRVSAKPVPDLQVRSEPDGKSTNLTAGCRPPVGQVETIDQQHLTVNLSACSDRTSGAPPKTGSRTRRKGAVPV